MYISANVTNLSTTAQDGLRLYDLKTGMVEIDTPNQLSAALRQISAVKWITGADDPWETLCFGTARGWLTVWRQNVRKVSFISVTKEETLNILQ